MRDLFHDLTVIRAIPAQSLGATGSGGKASHIIKRDGSNQVLFDINYGAISATGGQVIASMTAGDATGSLSAVASADVMGPGGIGAAAALLAAGIGATSARASGVSKNVGKTVAYVGTHEYVQLTLAPKVSGGIIASANALLGLLRTAPGTQAG
jgi:hypothetical protein